MIADLLALYDAETRKNPPPRSDVLYERPGGVLRVRGPGNWIFACDLDTTNADLIIAREVNFFRNLGEDVEWKVYGHDLPPDLASRLAARGFEADESETLMFFDLANAMPRSVPKGFEIRQVTDLDALQDFIRVGNKAFGRDHLDMLPELKTVILGNPPLGFAFIAYAAGDMPVAAGRMESVEGYSFASLFGGGTIPEFRKRGIFRALVSARAELARRRGHSYLSVDARETSRPILEQLGFKSVTTITGWNLRAAARPA